MLRFLLHTFKSTLNVNAQRYDGCTAADVAYGLNFHAAEEILVRAGANPGRLHADDLSSDEMDSDTEVGPVGNFSA